MMTKKTARVTTGVKKGSARKPAARGNRKVSATRLTEVVFIIDRSGSMCGQEADTIGGFNAMLAKQRMERGEVIVSTVLFDDKVEVLHDRVSLSYIKDLTERDYYVRGSTALFDAVGGAIDHIGRLHKYAPKTLVPEKTIFVIITDGYENSSRRYSHARLRQMIDNQQAKYGWEFIYLGANIDAEAAAADIGIDAQNAVNYHCDGQGLQNVYGAVSACMSEVRRSGKIQSAWRQDVDRDFQSR